MNEPWRGWPYESARDACTPYRRRGRIDWPEVGAVLVDAIRITALVVVVMAAVYLIGTFLEPGPVLGPEGRVVP